MSVINGYRDILVRKVDDLFKVDGLSPAGHKWVDNNISCSYVGIYPEFIGPLVSKAISSGLSVEVR